jgi:hypothetical protein
LLKVLESAKELEAYQQRSFYQTFRPSITLNPITELTCDQFILWLNLASPYELESGRIELETLEKMCAT